MIVCSSACLSNARLDPSTRPPCIGSRRFGPSTRPSSARPTRISPLGAAPSDQSTRIGPLACPFWRSEIIYVRLSPGLSCARARPQIGSTFAIHFYSLNTDALALARVLCCLFALSLVCKTVGPWPHQGTAAMLPVTHPSPPGATPMDRPPRIGSFESAPSARPTLLGPLGSTTSAPPLPLDPLESAPSARPR